MKAQELLAKHKWSKELYDVDGEQTQGGQSRWTAGKGSNVGECLLPLEVSNLGFVMSHTCTSYITGSLSIRQRAAAVVQQQYRREGGQPNLSRTSTESNTSMFSIFPGSPQGGAIGGSGPRSSSVVGAGTVAAGTHPTAESSFSAIQRSPHSDVGFLQRLRSLSISARNHSASNLPLTAAGNPLHPPPRAAGILSSRIQGENVVLDGTQQVIACLVMCFLALSSAPTPQGFLSAWEWRWGILSQGSWSKTLILSDGPKVLNE